jgi:prepilin-type N-terminal cleavage/methylation domain-containing protein
VRKRERGFSLAELLVAMGIFLLVAGAAVMLFSRHMPLFTRQQNLAALNIGVRNAVSQLQMDLANAGTGVFSGVNVANWPIGITVVNSVPQGSCYDAVSDTYSADCFDALNVIAADPAVPPVHPDAIGTNCVSTTSAITFVQAAQGLTLAETAANYRTGDRLLFVKGDGSQMTTAVLTANGAVSGIRVRLQHNPTGADGTNSGANDPLGISTLPNNKLGSTYCTEDWVLKLSPILYRVDTAAENGPALMRMRGNDNDVVAEQIIGFKIGVTLWNDPLATTSEEYNFDAESYNRDYTLIRSIRISLIGRTRPNREPGFAYRNGFDGGPYQIQAASVVVHPRNLSLKD